VVGQLVGALLQLVLVLGLIVGLGYGLLRAGQGALVALIRRYELGQLPAVVARPVGQLLMRPDPGLACWQQQMLMEVAANVIRSRGGAGVLPTAGHWRAGSATHALLTENLSLVQSELRAELAELAAGQDWITAAPFTVRLTRSPGLDHDELVLDGFDFSVPTVELAGSTATDLLAPAPSATLVPLGGGAPLILDRDLVNVGRSAQADLRLSPTTCSRSHAELVRTGPGWVVRDLGSTHGTFIGERQVREQLLRDGDVVRFAGAQFRFTAKTVVPTRPE
jgi:hypothetical protein